MSALASQQPPSLLGKLALAARDIKLAHSVFALPFALLAAFMARPTGGGGELLEFSPFSVTPQRINEWAGFNPAGAWTRFAGQLALVLVCMVAARTWAMMVNRLADRTIDAANPRTIRRAVASGVLPVRDARLITAGAAALFIAACGLFAAFYGNIWPLALSGPVLGWIALYSYTKRFTWMCHLFLGGALAVSPIAAAIAIDPEALVRVPALYLLAGFVLLWVAGFDVIYALQDLEFDRGAGLHSIPQRLGSGGAIVVSRLLHAAAAALLLSAWRAEPRFGAIFGAACVLAAGLLVAEHVILARRGKAGLDMAFFTVNGVVSCVIGAAGIVDVLAG
ncbi:MAG: 4-hydroxybenzoate octaprenyltransferase [Phycisphaerales bacterium]|nr:4-hydroxybenzoate octaprenyltransferase [Phycisphaerales bacterium]